MIYDNQKLSSQIYQPLQTDKEVEETPKTIDAYEKDGKKFIVTFLLDSTINDANFAVRKDFIPKHIKRFEGKPYILTKIQLENGQQIAYHPSWDDVKSASVQQFSNVNEFVQDYINKLFKSQSPFTIGTIRKVEQDKNNNDMWKAHVELTDEKARAAFDLGHIPKYVSPSLFAYNFDENGYVMDFEPLHLAAVDTPSYGFQKARVYSECTGTENFCLGNNIKQGSVPIHCVEKELLKFKNTFNFNSSFIDSRVKSASKIDLSAQTTVSTGQNVPTMADTSQVSPQAGNVQGQPRTNDAISSFVATSPTQTINPQVQAQTPRQNFPNELIPKAELEKFAEPLNNEIKTLKSQLETLLEAKQKDDLADKKDIIAGYITATKIPNNEEREQEINDYLELPVSKEQLIKLLKKRFVQEPLDKSSDTKKEEQKDLKGNVKSGGLVPNYRKTIKEYSDDSGIGVLQGGNANQIEVDPKLVFNFVHSYKKSDYFKEKSY